MQWCDDIRAINRCFGPVRERNIQPGNGGGSWSSMPKSCFLSKFVWPFPLAMCLRYQVLWPHTKLLYSESKLVHLVQYCLLWLTEALQSLKQWSFPQPSCLKTCQWRCRKFELRPTVYKTMCSVLPQQRVSNFPPSRNPNHTHLSSNKLLHIVFQVIFFLKLHSPVTWSPVDGHLLCYAYPKFLWPHKCSRAQLGNTHTHPDW